MLVERMRKFCRYNRSNDPGANVLIERMHACWRPRLSEGAVYANVLVARMRKFCRYIRSNPWSIAGHGAADGGSPRARCRQMCSWRGCVSFVDTSGANPWSALV